MDDRSDLVGPVVAGNGEFLHLGWIHSHSVGTGGDLDPGPDYSRQKPRVRKL